jgi:hypothetical protein
MDYFLKIRSIDDGLAMQGDVNRIGCAGRDSWS